MACDKASTTIRQSIHQTNEMEGFNQQNWKVNMQLMLLRYRAICKHEERIQNTKAEKWFYLVNLIEILLGDIETKV